MATKIGTLNGYSVFIEAEVEESNGKQRVSITGYTQYRPNTDYSSAGQILDNVRLMLEEGKPIKPRAKIKKLLNIWERWHLNDLRPGCEHQENYKREMGHNYPETFFYAANLKQIWELPQFENCPTCDYRYGSAWKYEPVPEEVIKFIEEF